MTHKCFVYVVLASIISSRVIAAPTAQFERNSDYPAMCDDSSVPWKQKWGICDPCDIPDLPINLRDRFCGSDGPDAHERAQGIYRRDAAGSILRKDGEEDVKFHSLPYQPDHAAIIPARPSPHSFPIVRPPIFKPGPVIVLDSAINPKPTSELTSRATTTDDIHMKSKRDSVQTFNAVGGNLPVEAGVRGNLMDTHRKATGIYARQKMPAGTEFQPSRLTTDAATADEIKETNSEDSKDVAATRTVEEQEGWDGPRYAEGTHKPAPGVWRRQKGSKPPGPGPEAHPRVGSIWKKREANRDSPLQGQQPKAKTHDGMVIHKPVSGAWKKREMHFGAVTHGQGHAVSTDPWDIEKKRDASPVTSPLQGQPTQPNPHRVGYNDPVSMMWRKRTIYRPRGAVALPQAKAIVWGGHPPANEKKREASLVPLPELLKDAHLPLKPVPSSVEESKSVEGPVLFPHPQILPRQSSTQQNSSPSEAPPSQTSSETQDPETPVGTATQDSSSTKATSLPHVGVFDIHKHPQFAPAIAHPLASDIQRREERVRASEWVG